MLHVMKISSILHSMGRYVHGKGTVMTTLHLELYKVQWINVLKLKLKMSLKNVILSNSYCMLYCISVYLYKRTWYLHHNLQFSRVPCPIGVHQLVLPASGNICCLFLYSLCSYLRPSTGFCRTVQLQSQLSWPQMLLLHQCECTVKLVWEVTGQWPSVEVDQAIVLIGCPLQLAVRLVRPWKPGAVSQGRRREW